MQLFDWARDNGSEKLKLYIEEGFDWERLAIHEYAQKFSKKFPLFPESSFSKFDVTSRKYPEVDEIKHLKEFKEELSKSNYKFKDEPKIAWAIMKIPYFDDPNTLWNKFGVSFDTQVDKEKSKVECECIEVDLSVPYNSHKQSVKTVALLGYYFKDPAKEDLPF
jgi:hypothetical protein